jgi:hypothetical protein
MGNEAPKISRTTQFVLLAVKHDASYWAPPTLASELAQLGVLPEASIESLDAFRDEVLRSLVGRAAERFWASDAVTATNAAAIRAACQALHTLTVEVYAEALAEAKRPTAAG